MTEEEKTEKSFEEVQRVMEHGTKEEKFNLIMTNTIALCHSTEVCPGCIGEMLTEIAHGENRIEKGAIH